MPLQIDEIRVISDLIKVKYDANTHVLTISSDLNPLIIDRNFNELEERLNNLDKKVNQIMFNYTKIT